MLCMRAVGRQSAIPVLWMTSSIVLSVINIVFTLKITMLILHMILEHGCRPDRPMDSQQYFCRFNEEETHEQ